MKTILSLCLFLLPFIATAQSGNAQTFDHAPEFPGGMPGIQEYLKIAVRYPETARKANTEGRVEVKFAIDISGAVTDVSVMKSVSPLLDEEAVRVVKAMPNWKPGTYHDQKVKVYLALPIIFELKEPSANK
jgi:TonB family protein